MTYLDEIRARANAVLDNGGTVEFARDVLVVLAECERLQGQLAALAEEAGSLLYEVGKAGVGGMVAAQAAVLSEALGWVVGEEDDGA